MLILVISNCKNLLFLLKFVLLYIMLQTLYVSVIFQIIYSIIFKLYVFAVYFYICHIYPPFTRKRIVSLHFGGDLRTRLGVAVSVLSGQPVFHIKAGRPVTCLAQGQNK